MGFRAPSEPLAPGRITTRARHPWSLAGVAGVALLVWAGGCRVDDLVNPTIPGPGAEGPPSGNAQRLEFVTQPDDVEAGGVIAPPIEVVARDEDGRVATSFTGMISLAVEERDANVTLRGLTGRPAVAGVAVFANLSVDRPGRGYRLEATAHGLTRAVSDRFDVDARPGGPAQLWRHRGESQTDTIHATLGDPYVVRVVDAHDNPVPGVTVQWQVEGGGGTVAPAAGVTDERGEAAARHTLGGQLGEQRVLASVQGADQRVTFTATAIHGAPASLLFVQQPTNAEEGERIRPPPAVAAFDRLGNPATHAGGEVSLTLLTLSGSARARLRGDTDRPLVDGVAVFTDLEVDRSGSAYLLRARLGSLATTSQPFRVDDD